MIYISSSCVKGEIEISSVLDKCISAGFLNIELSGGTEYEENIAEKLLVHQERNNLNLLCHNYFPSPKVPFVANLASLDETIHKYTIEHFKRSIDLSITLGATKFGLHAGFYTDIFLNQIGKNIEKRPLYDKKKAMARFCRSFEELMKYANDKVLLYIENNVIALHNYENYEKNNLFMLTTLDEYEELRKQIDFPILLDIAHLYVSSKTLGISFIENASALWEETDYIHISDNDGIKDLNKPLNVGGDIYSFLEGENLGDKTFTFEIYDTFSNIQDSIDLFSK